MLFSLEQDISGCDLADIKAIVMLQSTMHKYSSRGALAAAFFKQKTRQVHCFFFTLSLERERLFDQVRLKLDP